MNLIPNFKFWNPNCGLEPRVPTFQPPAMCMKFHIPLPRVPCSVSDSMQVECDPYQSAFKALRNLDSHAIRQRVHFIVLTTHDHWYREKTLFDDVRNVGFEGARHHVANFSQSVTHALRRGIFFRAQHFGSYQGSRAIATAEAQNTAQVSRQSNHGGVIGD